MWFLQAVSMTIPMGVFNTSSALPKDPILRKQHLEELMTNIHGSFNFMQVEFGKYINVLTIKYKAKLWF